MNMKRIVLVVVCILITVFAVVGCGGKQSASNDTVVTEDAEITAVKNTVFQADKWQDAQKLVADSKLSDEDKRYFQIFIRGYSLNQYSGKTIGELIEMVKITEGKVDKKEEKKAPSKINTNVSVVSAYKCDSFLTSDPPFDREGYNVRINVNFNNNSTKILQAVKMEYTVFDDFHEPLIVDNIDYTKLNMAPGTSAGYYVYTTYDRGTGMADKIQSISNPKVNVEVKIIKAAYADGTVESIGEVKK